MSPPAQLATGKRHRGAMMGETATTGDFESFGYSSEHLRAADRIPLYRDILDRWLMRIDFQPMGERFFRKARVCRLPNLSLFCVDGSAGRAGWAGVRIEEGFALASIASPEGAATLTQLGREASISGGSSILLSTADPVRMERTTARYVAVGVPRAVLAPMLANPDAALMRVIPSTNVPLRLLTGYVALLVKDPAPLETAELRRLAVHHVHDLVALSIGATRDAAEIAAGRGLRAARMRAIKADIAQNLAGDVTTAALSARHRLSPRYIRRLFEGENTSLSRFVLGQRLTCVNRMLVDPRYADRTITDIALVVGFGDISTFNREFRRRFGVTPSDMRHGAAPKR
jgi:AraC-like DNA-binding protein